MFTVARLRLDKINAIRGRVLSLSHLVAVGVVCLVSLVSIRVDLAVSIASVGFCSRRVLSFPGSLRCFVAGSTR